MPAGAIAYADPELCELAHTAAAPKLRHPPFWPRAGPAVREPLSPRPKQAAVGAGAQDLAPSHGIILSAQERTVGLA
jgi:hypothetical protein